MNCDCEKKKCRECNLDVETQAGFMPVFVMIDIQEEEYYMCMDCVNEALREGND